MESQELAAPQATQSGEDTISRDLEALRRDLNDLPPAQNEEQAQVLAAFEELMASLTRLGATVESMKQPSEDKDKNI